jgi:type II secretory pathway component HofQ
MNASKFLCIAALLASATLAVAEDPRLEVKNEDDRRTVNVLQSLKVSLNFTDTPLEEVASFLREVTSLNILLSREAREVAMDKQVTLKVDDLRLSDALGLIVDMTEMSYKIEDGVIILSSKSEVKGDTYLELYDVRDLLFHLRDFVAPTISLSDTSVSEGGAMGITTEGASDTGDSLEDPALLVELIKNHTCGTSWTDNPKCSVEIQNGILVVVQTKQGHKDVWSLVEKLRQYK